MDNIQRDETTSSFKDGLCLFDNSMVVYANLQKSYEKTRYLLNYHAIVYMILRQQEDEYI